MNDTDNYVSLIRIPEASFKRFVIIFTVLAVTHGILESFSIFSGWLNIFGDSYPIRSSVVMTLIVGNYFVVINLKEFLMYLWGKAFIEKIKEQARVEGRNEGFKQGKNSAYQEVLDWEERKKEAELKGEEFKEPPPYIKPESESARIPKNSQPTAID